MSERPATHTVGIPESSQHHGHLIDYNERALVSYTIERIDGNDVVLSDERPEVEDTTESFLYCITCGVQISGDEVGAEDWEVR